MKVRRLAETIPSARRALAIESLALIAFLICASPAAGAASGDRAEEVQILIKRGETYLITGADPARNLRRAASPIPHALIVNKQPDGSVLVLGANPGVQSVIVARPDGQTETYTFTVQAIANPANPLAPGTDPSATSESLDDGAGPVVNGASSSPPAASSERRADAQAAPASPAFHDGAAVISVQGELQKYATNPPAIRPAATTRARVGSFYLMTRFRYVLALRGCSGSRLESGGSRSQTPLSRTSRLSTRIN